MSVKFGSVILVIVGLFVAKISFDNFQQAQASDNGLRVETTYIK